MTKEFLGPRIVEKAADGAAVGIELLSGGVVGRINEGNPDRVGSTGGEYPINFSTRRTIRNVRGGEIKLTPIVPLQSEI